MRMEQSSSFMFKMCQQEETLEQLICGTAYYCAPEVWFNDYSPSVDIWATGVVLYLALFGSYPFYHKDQQALEELICDEDREPSYRPVNAQDHPDYQVSSLAIGCLKELLSKAKEDRPDAATALQLPWVDAPKSFNEASHDWWPSASASKGPRSVGGVQLLGSWDQVIPPSVRAKAGRSAMPPAVEAVKEQRRTQALEDLKMRTVYGVYGDTSINGLNSMKVLPTPNRPGHLSREASSFISKASRGDAGEHLKCVGIPVQSETASIAETISDCEEYESGRPISSLMCACQ